MPRLRLTWRRFCKEVENAVADLPEAFHRYLTNVVVDVQEEPDENDWRNLADRGDPRDSDLLGLFEGVPLTEQSYGFVHPNRIKVFRRPLEEASRTREELLMHIQETIVHEFAHHFGLTEEDLEPFESAMEEKRRRLFGDAE